MFWVRIFVALIALGVWPVQAGAKPADESAQIAAYVAAEGEISRSMALEPGALAAAGGHVKRAGPVLTFALVQRTERVRIEDRADCQGDVQAAGCQQFVLVASLPRRHCYIVVKSRFDGTDYILIDDRTGKGLVFPGPPQFAPLGGRILVLTSHEMGQGPAIEIWRRDANGAATPDWIHPIGGDVAAAYAPGAGVDVLPQSMTLLRWSGDRIDLALRYPAVYDRKPFTLRARLTRARGEWSFAVIKPK